MARYLSASEAASLVLEQTFSESGDESEIEEDPDFPLPHEDDYAELPPAQEEQPHLPFSAPVQQPLPFVGPSARAPSAELELSSSSPTGPAPEDSKTEVEGRQKRMQKYLSTF